MRWPLVLLVWLLSLGFCASAAAADQGSQVAGLEAVAQTYFHGVPIWVEQVALAARMDRYNAALNRRQAELAGSSQSLTAALAPLRELEALIARSSASLAVPPPLSDGVAVRRYNASVAEHNRLVSRHESEVARLRPSIDAQAQQTLRLQQEFAGESAALEKAKAELERRFVQWQAFAANDGEVRYQGQVNRALAELHVAAGAGRGRPDLLARVRALRGELAAWAKARYAAEPNGLILVPALVGDEPCQFILDTGAQSVTLSEDLVRALGLQARLGVAETIRGVGGGKVQGRTFTLPRITVLGRSADAVEASVLLKPEGVGIDGLLGQSFLKAFRLSICPGAAVPVQLDPR